MHGIDAILQVYYYLFTCFCLALLLAYPTRAHTHTHTAFFVSYILQSLPFPVLLLGLCLRSYMCAIVCLVSRSFSGRTERLYVWIVDHIHICISYARTHKHFVHVFLFLLINVPTKTFRPRMSECFGGKNRNGRHIRKKKTLFWTHFVRAPASAFEFSHIGRPAGFVVSSCSAANHSASHITCGPRQLDSFCFC